MTREEFISKFDMRLFGRVCDACVGSRSGMALAKFQIQSLEEIRLALGLAYDALAPAQPLLPKKGEPK